MSKKPAPDKDEEKEKLRETIRKLAYLGAGTLFMTQEGLSRVVSEQLKLPKEMANSAVNQVEKARQEAVQSITTLFSSYLESIDLIDLARKVVHGMEVNVKASVRLSFDQIDDDSKKGS